MNEIAYYQKKQNELEALITQIERKLSVKIEGSLRISSFNGHYKYYRHRKKPATDDADKVLKDQYLGKADLEIARQLAQQEYEKQLLKTARSLLQKVKGRAVEFDDHPLQDVYDSLHEARKALVTPLVLTDDEYARRWLTQKYDSGFFSENIPFLLSERGERIRSKSEKIIADKYHRLNVPYLYERPLQLKAGNQLVTLRPDFTLLNKRTRQVYYHEHFGMIDKPDYADNCLKKLELYAANGFFPGDNLLITMESSQHVLNEQYLDLIIATYLL